MEFPKAPLTTPWVKRAGASLLGMLGGYFYYYFVGCASGTCPISSNPWIDAAYGGLLGFIMTMQSKKGTVSGDYKRPVGE